MGYFFLNSIVLYCNFPALKWAVLKTIQKGQKKNVQMIRFGISLWFLYPAKPNWIETLGLFSEFYSVRSSTDQCSSSTLTSYDVKLARLISLATHFQFGKKANLKKRGQHKSKLRRLNACRLIKHWSLNLKTWGL